MRERVLLGCASEACFCTGRCKRTAEEQEAYERQDRIFKKVIEAGAKWRPRKEYEPIPTEDE